MPLSPLAPSAASPTPGATAVRRSARRRALLGLLAVALVLGVAACTTDDDARPAATVPPTVAPLARDDAQTTVVPTLPVPLGFVPADTRGVALPVAKSNPVAPPPLPVRGGEAQLSGTVFGPDGPVEGAVVRIERFIGFRTGHVDITTGKGGRYVVDDLLGGKLRVRAWSRPDLATVEPQTIYLIAQGNGALDLTVERHDATKLQGALALPDPKIDQQVLFQALLTKEEVDENGIVVAKGIDQTELVLQATPGIDVLSANPIKTDVDGVARWNVQCTAAGAHPVSLVGGGQSITLVLPECRVPKPDETTTTSSTSTTLGPVPDWPVGGRFRIPFAGPVPAGTYETKDTGCQVTFELYNNGSWSPVQFRGQVVAIPGPGRSFAPQPGTPACTFERIR